MIVYEFEEKEKNIALGYAHLAVRDGKVELPDLVAPEAVELPENPTPQKKKAYQAYLVELNEYQRKLALRPVEVECCEKWGGVLAKEKPAKKATKAAAKSVEVKAETKAGK